MRNWDINVEVLKEEALSTIKAVTSHFKEKGFTDDVFQEENLLVVSDSVNFLLNALELSKTVGESTEELDQLIEEASQKLRSFRNHRKEAKLFGARFPLTFVFAACLKACSRLAFYFKEKGHTEKEKEFSELADKIADSLLSFRGKETFWSWGLDRKWREKIGKADLYATALVIDSLSFYLKLKKREQHSSKIRKVIKKVAEEILKSASKYEISNVEEPMWYEWVEEGRKRPLDHFCGLAIVLSALETGVLSLKDISVYETPFMEACRTAISIKLSPFNYLDYHRYLSPKYPAVFVEEGVSPFYQFLVLTRFYDFFSFKNVGNVPLLVQEFLEEMKIFLTSTLTRQRTAEVFCLIEKIKGKNNLWIEGSFLVYLTAEGVLAYAKVLKEFSKAESLWLGSESREEYVKFLVARSAKEILQSETFASNFAYQLYLALEDKVFPLLFRKQGGHHEQ